MEERESRIDRIIGRGEVLYYVLTTKQNTALSVSKCSGWDLSNTVSFQSLYPKADQPKKVG